MKKLTILVIAVMLVAGLLAGCWLFPEESRLDRIEADSIIVTVGNTRQLEVTAFYDDGTSADVTSDCDYWADHPEFATVNYTGLVTGVAVGEMYVYVKYYQENDFTNQRVAEVNVPIKVLEIQTEPAL